MYRGGLPRLPRWMRVGIVILYAGALFVASVVDPPADGLSATGPLGVVPADKWLHALGYATLASLLAYASLAQTRRTLLLVTVVTVGYGVGIEVVQATLPVRSFDVADVAANAVGAVVAVLWWGRFAVVRDVD